MLQVLETKQAKDNKTGNIIDVIKIMIVGKPNQSIESLKEEYNKYIPSNLLNKKSKLNNSEGENLPVFTFWRRK